MFIVGYDFRPSLKKKIVTEVINHVASSVVVQDVQTTRILQVYSVLIVKYDFRPSTKKKCNVNDVASSRHFFLDPGT